MQSHSMKVLLREKIQRHEDGSIEHWRDVVGFEGFYRVSDRGRVKSTVRRVKTSNGKIGRTVPGKMLLIFGGADGRLYANLGKDNRICLA